MSKLIILMIVVCGILLAIRSIIAAGALVKNEDENVRGVELLTMLVTITSSITITTLAYIIMG